MKATKKCRRFRKVAKLTVWWKYCIWKLNSNTYCILMGEVVNTNSIFGCLYIENTMVALMKLWNSSYEKNKEKPSIKVKYTTKVVDAVVKELITVLHCLLWSFSIVFFNRKTYIDWIRTFPLHTITIAISHYGIQDARWKRMFTAKKTPACFWYSNIFL